MKQRYYALIGRVLGYAGQFFIIAILPLILTPDLFAKYNLIVPLLMLSSSLAFGWLNGAAFRWSHKIVSKSRYIYRSSIAFYYTVLLIIMVLCSVTLSFMGYIYEAIFPFIVFVLSVKDYFLKVSNASEDYKKFAWTNGFVLIGKISFVLLVFKFNLNHIYWIMCAFLGSELFFIIPFIGIKRKIKTIRIKRYCYVLKRMLNYGAPLIAASMSVWLISLSDRYILAFYLSELEVANYVLIYQFAANSITIPIMFFITMYYPKLIKMERDIGLMSTLKYNNKMLNKYLLISPIYGIISICLIWILLDVVYKQYNADILLVTVIVFSQIFSGAGHFYNKKYELNNNTKYIAISVFFAAIINVVGNFYMIPRMGLIGASYSSLIAYLFLIIFTKRADKIMSFKIETVSKK
ncbi:MAG: hypothetical protein methR_P1470 [Methyloprofundus sp.]|nr:MAG: hypothetical protein methR_P1470 [Methyloprofundus sp.]